MQVTAAELRHRSLVAAIGAAALEFGALVEKGGKHSDKGFSYVRHEDVLEHTRTVVLNHGVAILHGDLKYLATVDARGTAKLFLWEQTIEARLVGGDEKERFKACLQVMTGPDDAAAAKASTAADRVFLMRLLRLAGGEHVEERGQRGRGQRDNVDEHGEVHPDPKAQAATVGEALKHLAKCDLVEEKLVHWFRAAHGNLEAARVTDAQRNQVWAAFVKRCKEARLDADKLAERARAPSNNRRTTKE